MHLDISSTQLSLSLSSQRQGNLTVSNNFDRNSTKSSQSSTWAPILTPTSTQSPPAQQKPQSTPTRMNNPSSSTQAGCKYSPSIRLQKQRRKNRQENQKQPTHCTANKLTPPKKLPFRPTRLVRPRRKENPLPIHRSKSLQQTPIPPNPQPPRPRPHPPVR